MSRNKSNSSNGEAYLKLHPELARWLDVCVSCGLRGYKPDLPERLEAGTVARHLRRWFPLMRLNDNGRCEKCAPPNDSPASQADRP
jgi:hypothetical protein